MATARSKKAWAILVSCCAFYAGSMALTNSILGVYMLPVSEDIGVTRAEFTLYLTAQGVACLVFLPLVGNLFNRVKNFNLLMSIGSICLALGIGLFSVATTVAMFCAFSILIAFGMTCLYSIGGPTLITNWFAPRHRGKMLGIAAAFSGVGTFVWAPVFTGILQGMGWHVAYVINAVLSLVLTLPFCLFVIKRSPEDVGQLPYGAEGGDVADVRQEAGVSVKKAFATPALYLIELCCLACCLGMGYNSSLPAMCIETYVPTGLMDAGGAAMIGATLISVAAAGNVIGKIAYGVMVDKAGSRISLVVFAAFTFVAFAIWAFTDILPGWYVAAFLFGTHNALMSVSFPLLTRQVYGNRNFPKIWSYLSMPFTVLGPSATAIVSALYLASGSYFMPLVVGMIGIAAVAVLAIGATAFIGKYEWAVDDARSEEAAA